MKAAQHSSLRDTDVIVIGAGIAGLATAARLAHSGAKVTVFEAHSTPGGKMRCLPSVAGPVDAGPTVLTMRPVFEQLYEELGERLGSHLELVRQSVIARHFWPDGSQLDLHDTEDASAEAIANFAGDLAAKQFRAFCAQARRLFEAFDVPMMQSAAPSLGGLARHVCARPGLIPKLAPLSSLDRLLRRQFDDPRLTQLFGRYATYVGGSPYQSPALLGLIWQAEAAGVWAVQGGMHQLARSLEGIARTRGAEFHYDTPVKTVLIQDGMAKGVTLPDGTTHCAATVVFNGDARALSLGALGDGCARVAPQTKSDPRSLSAEVWAFAARVTGPDLAHHNIFFRNEPKGEFDRLARGERVSDPTVYVCAMDRGLTGSPPEIERFETIVNAPPLTLSPADEDISRCQTRTFQTLARFGLRFDRVPGPDSLTTPAGFDALFPSSAGALYGQSPHGLTAALRRPKARTAIKGLYLAGGTAHPGAGVPMAVLSARHAAEAILTDRISTSTFPQTDMPGGMSTASATAVVAPSASLDS